MTTVSNNRVATSIVWSAIDRFGIVLLQFVINVVLARLLIPQDFGLVGMIMIFVIVSQALIDGGFASALIQKQGTTPVDYSTIFYWNILFSVVLYLIIYVSSNKIALFFNMPQLENLLRVYGVVIVINSFGLVQKTLLRKFFEFKKIAITDIISYTIAATVAILMARQGFGAWSLVGMYLVNATISSFLFWILSAWRPILQFSVKSLKSLFSYGGYLLIAGIMQEVCNHIQGVVIGRKFSATETGLYSQSKKMDEVASLTIPAIMCQVLFPLFSENQTNHNEMVRLLKNSQQAASFIIFPLMTLLIVLAKPVMLLLYGNQWIDSVPYFQILCIGGFFSALYNFGYYAVAALGKSKDLFYWGCYKWGVLIILLLIGAQISMQAVLWAMVMSNVNIFLTNALLVQHYIGYKLFLQIKDVLPILLVSLVSGVVAFVVYDICNIHWVFVSLIFIVVYLSLSALFKIEILYNKDLFIRKIYDRFLSSKTVKR